MYQRRRQRLITHSIEDQREEIFEGLKMKLEVLHELNDVFKNDIDPVMRQQVEQSKQDLRNDFRQLIGSGVSIMDLYKRFGALMFKSDVVEKQQVLQTLSQGKEKQLIDLLNEDEKLVQRLNALNNPLNQTFRQRLRAAPLQVRPDGQTLKQEYEKQQVLRQFAQNFQQFIQRRGGPRPGPGGGGGGGPGAGGPGPGFGGGGAGPGFGGQPPAPRNLPGNQPRPNPNQFNPGQGPQGGGGGIMRQNPRPNAQQQLRQFQMGQINQNLDSDDDMLPPPPGQDVLQQAMRQRGAQLDMPQPQIQQQQQPYIMPVQINEDVAMAMNNAIRQEEEKKAAPKRDLRVVKPRQPVHQPQLIEEEKKERSRSNTRSRTRQEAGLDQPMIQQVPKRKKSQSRSQTRDNNAQPQRIFHEIEGGDSGFFLRSPDQPIQLSNVKDKVMENEEITFGSPINSSDKDYQMSQLARQVRKNETNLRHPSASQSRSQAKTERQKDVGFMAQVNEIQRQAQLGAKFNNLYNQLGLQQEYTYETEEILRQIEEPAGQTKNEYQIELLINRLFNLMNSTKIVKGIEINKDLQESYYREYRRYIQEKYDEYKNGEYNRPRLSQLIIQYVFQYFDDIQREQEELNKKQQMRAAAEPQYQRPPDPEPEQDRVLAENDSLFKVHTRQLLDQKQYYQLLKEAGEAYGAGQISLLRAYNSITHVAVKCGIKEVQQDFINLSNLMHGGTRVNDQEILNTIQKHYQTLMEYFSEQESPNLMSGLPLNQSPVFLDQNQQIDQGPPPEVNQLPQNRGVETRSQSQNRGRSMQVDEGQPRDKPRSASAIRGDINDKEYKQVSNLMQQGNFDQALNKIQEGVINYIQWSQNSRNKAIPKPDYYFATDTAKLQKIMTYLIESNADQQTRDQLVQEYQRLGGRSKNLSYARNLNAFLESIRQQFMQGV